MEICNHTKNEVEGAVSAACDALTPKAATYARIRGDTQTLMLLHEYDRQQELIRLQVQQHEVSVDMCVDMRSASLTNPDVWCGTLWAVTRVCMA